MATPIERERAKEKAVHDKLDLIIKLLKEVLIESEKGKTSKKVGKVQSK